MNKVNKATGYTLAEVLLVVGLIGVLSLVVPPLFLQTIRFVRLHLAKAEIQRDARLSLEMINRSLKQAKASSITIDQASGNSPYSSITFETIEGTGYRFYQDKKNLVMEIRRSGLWSGAKILSKNLRYIAFTYPRTDDTRILSVSITTEKQTYEGGAKALQLSQEKIRIMNP